MKLSLVTLLLFLSIQVCDAQKKSSFDAKGLKVTWETVENNYKGTKETYSKLIFTNISKEVFPSSGWTLYFNGPDLKNLNEGPASIQVELVNGDFFKATPSKTFKGLGAGKSETLALLSRNLIKRTDFPRGFYIVFNNRPNDAIPVIHEALTSVDYSRDQQLIAEKDFKENDAIEDIPLNLLPPIFPSPSSVKKTKDIFNLTKLTKVIVDPLFSTEATYLSEEFEKLFNFKPVQGTTEKQNVIILQKLSLPSKEAYKLQVTSNEIIIGASGREGLFYGIQSLKNLFPSSVWSTKQDAVSIPGILVSDAPRFPHRAFMMDIARNFQGKKEILKIIDMISFYKLNVLHLHLNDDEGWRIEIPGLPELTEVGSKRGHTTSERENLVPSYGSGPTVNSNSGSGFLTRADYLEILKYATQRHVEVIPEFETPGHARAAIKSMNARYDKLL
ncbi:MAG: beta-N-acetylhexosaminidase, partial [Pedobacter sp.]